MKARPARALAGPSRFVGLRALPRSGTLSRRDLPASHGRCGPRGPVRCRLRWKAVFSAVAGAALISCGGGDADQACGLADQKAFLRAWTDNLYLWYQEVPTVNAAQYTTATDYFDQLRTLAKTPSGKDKDQFHFWYTTEFWQSLSQSGVEAGYGVTWSVVSNVKPREWRVAYTEAGSPAEVAGLKRGARILQIDGV